MPWGLQCLPCDDVLKALWLTIIVIVRGDL